MAYIRTGAETEMGMDFGLGHSQAACCSECAAGKACGSPRPTGDLFEFNMSSIFPWLLVLGIGYLIYRSPETHGHLAGTARAELGRAHRAAHGAITRFRHSRARKKTKRLYRRR